MLEEELNKKITTSFESLSVAADEELITLEAKLIKAIEDNDAVTTSILLVDGLNPDYIYTKYNDVETTPLHEAIAKGHEKIIKILIDTDSNVIKEESLFIALNTDREIFSRSILSILLKNKAKISADLVQTLKVQKHIHYLAIEAVNCNRLDILSVLLKARVSLDFQINDYLDLMTSPLDRAIALNLVNYAKFLLKEAKVNPNTPINGFSYLLQAIDQKKFDLVSVLMHYGATFYERN